MMEEMAGTGSVASGGLAGRARTMNLGRVWCGTEHFWFISVIPDSLLLHEQRREMVFCDGTIEVP